MDTPVGEVQNTFENSGAVAIQVGQQTVHGNISIHQNNPNLLELLPCAALAAFNVYKKQDEPPCLQGTRVEILKRIMAWADGHDGRHIFWLNGMAGTGKSTIARTVARDCSEQERLGASFFFSRGGGDASHAGKFFTTIAWQLAKVSPSLKGHICDAIAKHHDIASQSLRDQWRQLIYKPLSKLGGAFRGSPLLIVVDALDECANDNEIGTIVQLFAEARSLETVRLHIFMTSRPDIPTQHGFCQIPDEHQDFVLHDISRSIVDRDISIFLEYKFKLIRQERSFSANWPDKQEIQHMIRKSSGLFIWAATACRFVRDGGRHAANRLSTILQGNTSEIEPEKQLDKIYLTVLKSSVPSEYNDQEKEYTYRIVRKILGTIVILSSPLPSDSLAKLLDVPEEEVNQTLKDLLAILVMPKDQSHPIRLHHPSFRDFLLKKDRCDDSHFWVDEKQAHRALADSCILLMSISLKRDICGIHTPGALTTDVENDRVRQCLPPEVQYACLFWVQHLQRSGAQLYENDQFHEFLREHLLHWLESLSWMQKTSEGILAIISLESIALANECPSLYAFIHDTKRFALYSRTAIEQAPLQIYYSALVFAPMMSIVRKQFEDQMPRWIQRLPKVQNDWSGLLQTLEGHWDWVSAVAFSPDGKQLASASRDGTVRLWDAATGAPRQTLEGHSDCVSAVAFSPDSKQLVSASLDGTVRLWDAATGAPRQTLESHSGWVNAVAFSPDGKQLASASEDRTVRLWDAATGAPQQMLKGHSALVSAVAFSPDSKQLASASNDLTVRLWDAATGAPRQTLESHSGWVNVVAFSPDGKQLVSASDDLTVRLWDVVTGAPQQVLEGSWGPVSAVAFSPEGKHLAVASGDGMVRLWDAATGAPRQTLEGHPALVTAVAFSPDGKQLAAASDDGMVRLWDAATGAPRQTLEGHPAPVSAVAFSPDGKQLASASDDGMVRLWDAATGAPRQTLEGHSDCVSAVAFSPDGKQLASASEDRTVRLWDAATGAPRQTLEGHPALVTAVAFSPDGKQLAAASGDGTARLWDVATGAPRQTLEGHSGRITAVAFSPDSKQLASASDDLTVRLWDAATGAPQQTLESHSDWVTAVAFSPDGKQLASASDDGMVRLWDAATGAPRQTLEFNAVIRTLSFSNDGSYLETDRGLVDITSLSPGAVPPQQNLLRGIFTEEQWIARGMENLLWLPSDYRAARAAVRGNIVFLGHASGRVSIFEFSF